jgi:predicted phosphodiesterase
MTQRTLVISDTHMARPQHVGHAPGAEQLRPLIASGIDRLIVNGDTAELHHVTMRADAARQVLRLFELCEEHGVELTLISGNHDPHLTDLRHLFLHDGAIFLTHGDVLHPAVAPWSEDADFTRRAVADALASLDDDARHRLEARLAAFQHVSHLSWLNLDRMVRASHPFLDLLGRPAAVIRMLHYWAILPRLAHRFVAEHAPHARYFLFGHAHRPGVWKRDGRVLINTGSFSLPGRPRGVLITPEALAVHAVVRHGHDYHLAQRPLARFALSAPSRDTLAA